MDDLEPPMSSAGPSSGMSLADARAVAETIRARMRYDVIGRDGVIDLVILALIADGHVLLEDFPGSGKTTLAKALGEAIVDDLPQDEIANIRRVQFTPDLLPSDVTGTTVFDPNTARFHFRPGPIFAHVLLADEINRTSPKVQSALLEAMAEKQTTVDNHTYRLDDLFFVIATQNPLDLAGTFPLPAAQLDRFLFKIRMTHISRDSELAVLASWGAPRPPCTLPQVTREDIIAARAALRREVQISPRIHECLVDLARAIREDKRSLQGVSTRSLVLAVPALQTLALLKGRDFVAPEDIEHLAPHIFQHRLALVPGAGDPTQVVRDALVRPMEALVRATLRR
jgi:MoxR-like ATPase